MAPGIQVVAHATRSWLQSSWHIQVPTAWLEACVEWLQEEAGGAGHLSQQQINQQVCRTCTGGQMFIVNFQDMFLLWYHGSTVKLERRIVGDCVWREGNVPSLWSFVYDTQSVTSKSLPTDAVHLQALVPDPPSFISVAYPTVLWNWNACHIQKNYM